MKALRILFLILLLLTLSTNAFAYRDYYGLATARDGNGNVIPYATVNVYLSGTTSPATIYDSSSSTTTLTSTTTNINGVYSFYVDRLQYSPSQTFKVVVSKLGYPSFTNDNVVINQHILGTYTISSSTTLSHSLVIPEGIKYILDADFIIDNSANLKCEKWEDNILSTHVYSDGVTNPVIYIPYGGVTIDGCEFGYVTDPSFNQGYPPGATSEKVGFIVVGSPSASSVIENVTIKNNHFKKSLLHDIALFNVRNPRILNNTHDSPMGTGVNGTWIYDWQIKGDKFYNTRDNAIYIEARSVIQDDSPNYSTNGIIDDIIIKDSNQGCIGTDTSIAPMISNVICDGTYSWPIKIGTNHASSATSWNAEKANLNNTIIRNAFGNYGLGKIPGHEVDIHTAVGGTWAMVYIETENVDHKGEVLMSNVQAELGVGGTGYNGLLIPSGYTIKGQNSSFSGMDVSPNRGIYGVLIGGDASTNATDVTISGVTFKHFVIGMGSLYSIGTSFVDNTIMDSENAVQGQSNASISVKHNRFKDISDKFYDMNSNVIQVIEGNVDLDRMNPYRDTVTCSSGNIATPVLNKQVTTNSFIDIREANASAAALTEKPYFSDIVDGISFKINHGLCTGVQRFTYEIKD